MSGDEAAVPAARSIIVFFHDVLVTQRVEGLRIAGNHDADVDAELGKSRWKGAAHIGEPPCLGERESFRRYEENAQPGRSPHLPIHRSGPLALGRRRQNVASEVTGAATALSRNDG